MARTIAEQIGATLANECGMAGIGVAFWRPSHGAPTTYFKGPAGEFLGRPENRSGTWCIDGGWGGPPGPIHVRWNEQLSEWENGGFCGRGFK